MRNTGDATFAGQMYHGIQWLIRLRYKPALSVVVVVVGTSLHCLCYVVVVVVIVVAAVVIVVVGTSLHCLRYVVVVVVITVAVVVVVLVGEPRAFHMHLWSKLFLHIYLQSLEVLSKIFQLLTSYLKGHGVLMLPYSQTYTLKRQCWQNMLFIQ